jgi:hypothetical protein
MFPRSTTKYYDRRTLGHEPGQHNQSFQSNISPPLGDRPQNRGKSAVLRYIAEGIPAAPFPAKPAICSLERLFSLKAEDVTPKHPSGFWDGKSKRWSGGAVNRFWVNNGEAG